MGSLSSGGSAGRLPPGPVTVIQPTRGWSSLGLRDLWEYRELLYLLVHRQIQGAFRRAIDSGRPALVEIIVEREADASMGVSLDAIREFEPLPITYDQPAEVTSSS